MSLGPARLCSHGPLAPSPCSDGCLTPLQARGVSYTNTILGDVCPACPGPTCSWPGGPSVSWWLPDWVRAGVAPSLPSAP